VNRARDWFEQGRYDLQHARNSVAAGDFSWACYAAQQAAEKAVKAVYLTRNLEGWGHVVRTLLEGLTDELPVPESLIEAARRLDLFYIPTRYPNGFPQGKPADFFGASDAERAIADAGQILAFCESKLRP